MSFSLSPPPDFLLEREQKPPHTVTEVITVVFRQWLLSLTTRIQASPNVQNTVALTAQAAAIGSTAVSVGTVAAGVYRLTFYARITTPASVSSSLTVNFGWTDGGVSCSKASVAITGNTTTTVGSESFLMRADQATALNYSTTYAAVGTPMQYALTVTIEQLS